MRSAAAALCCYTAIAAATCCCSSSSAGWQNCCCDSLNLIPVFSSSFKHMFFMYPLAVLCRFYGLDLPTSSVIAGMRGAKAGVSPPWRSPLAPGYNVLEN